MSYVGKFNTVLSICLNVARYGGLEFISKIHDYIVEGGHAVYRCLTVTVPYYSYSIPGRTGWQSWIVLLEYQV